MTLSRQELVVLDKSHVWHPYTEMGSYIARTDPLVIARAEGSRLFDVDGQSYLDANSSWWVATLGHNHPRLVQALTRQAETMCHCALAGITHPEAAQLADELCRVAPPGLTRVFFSDNGSTAVEVAIKMAVQLAVQTGRPRRNRFLTLESAFHGETVGASSLGGVEVFRRPFAGILFDCLRIEPPSTTARYARAFEELGRAVENGADQIAAVVLEPRVQGAAGMRIYDPEFLVHARALCDQHEIPLVLDEVFTGYGRTGPMWACQSAAVSPDVLCVAKGFSGGVLPMAATLTTERIFRGFWGDRSRALHYGHTYCGHPLGAAVAREVLKVYKEEKILERAAPKARAIATAFAELGTLPGVANARALGMIGAVDLEPSKSSAGEPAAAQQPGYLAETGWQVYEAARRRGVYLRPLGNVVYVAPPLNIPDADLAELLGKVREAIEEVVKR
jgi:adenosylmethionine-8-amino-7-oxononanoate aminotransferase